MKGIVSGLLFLGFMLGLVAPSMAQSVGPVHSEAAAAPEVILLKLMAAIRGNDYRAMRSMGTDRFRDGLTVERFDKLVTRIGNQVRLGYTATYLTALNQRGHQRHLWKVTFKESGEDALASIVLADDLVAGFWLQ